MLFLISNDISIKGNKNLHKKLSKNFGVSEIVYTFVVDLDL
jgi:hypothetical protein